METIGVFFGSRSPEREVSIVTAILIMKGLRSLGYSVVPIYISAGGKWCSASVLEKIAFYQKDNYDKEAEKFANWLLKTNQKGKLFLVKNSFFKKEIIIDVAFPSLHGSFGEDGTIQGLFEMFQVPYVGCDTTSSAIAMDKVLTKKLYQQLNIPTTNFVYYIKTNKDSDEWRDTILGLIKRNQLKYPLFVKPARLGSSIGISKVRTDEEMLFACEVAFHYDRKIIIEEGVEPVIDITCALREKLDGEIEASLLQESLFEAPFLSYEEKYLNKGATQLGSVKGKGKNYQIPAKLDEKLTKEIRDLSVKIFKEFGLSGISRVDYLVNSSTKDYYANEINTLPGTLYHHLWQASGISFKKLLKDLIIVAQKRFDYAQQLKYTFSSNILKKVSGVKFIN